MKIVIAGGSGFLGTALSRTLAAEGHDVAILTRQTSNRPPRTPRMSFVQWDPNGNIGPWANAIDGATAVVNLAGESIAAKRWSAAQKQKLARQPAAGDAKPDRRCQTGCAPARSHLSADPQSAITATAAMRP